MAVLAFGSVVLADSSISTTQPSAQGNSNILALSAESVNPQLMDTTPPAPAAPEAPAAPAAAAPAPPEGAIMQGLDLIGIGKEMENLHLSLSGYAEMGYFYDLTVPKNIAPPRSAPPDFVYFPGDYKNDLMLNQVELDFQRAIVDSSKFDIGFNIEGIYGRDAVYTHSNGILDNGNKHGNTSPDDDIDLEQAYLLVSAPLGTGLEFQIGKFDTLLGYEVINPSGNNFYTHSYLFSYGVPLTQTGILASYNLTSALKLTAGITRGWNQSTSDNNGAIDFLGQASWNINSELSATVNVSEGPESTGDNHDYWTVVEGIVAWQVSDQLKVAGDLLYGDANAIAQWYGLAGYATYDLNKFAALNLRGEFYHDGRGFTTGVGRTDTNYTEVTAGVAITPTPDINLLQSLTIRPEVRADFADQPVFDGRKSTQLTMAIDGYIKF
jgi:hypothetical protein